MKKALLLLLLSAPASAAPQLFFLELQRNGCHWRVRDMKDGKAKDHLLSAACPEPGTILFDSAAKRTLYALDGKLYELRWGKDDAARELKVALPDQAAAPLGVSLFVSADTGRLRAAYHAPVAEGDKEYDNSSLPRFGVPYWAVIDELDGRRWKRVAREPTESEAGDTPGLRVVGEHMKPKDGTTSLEDLLQGATCLSQDCAGGAQKLPKEEREALAKALAIKADEEPGVLGGFACRIIYGDTPHASPPVLLRASKRAVFSGPKPNQLGLSIRDGLLLLAEEYYGNHPRVFDSGGRKVFESDTATAAAWLPFPL